MKNIFLGLAITVVLFSQASFAQSTSSQTNFYQQQTEARALWIKNNPTLVAQQDQTAKAFYQQQTAARALWIKNNQSLIAQQDQAAKAYYQQQEQARAAARNQTPG